MTEETKPQKEIPKHYWLINQVTTSKEKGEVIDQKSFQLTTNQISKLRIPNATGKNLYDFRHGKPLRLELNDAFVTYTLTRPQIKGVQNDNN